MLIDICIIMFAKCNEYNIVYTTCSLYRRLSIQKHLSLSRCSRLLSHGLVALN